MSKKMSEADKLVDAGLRQLAREAVRETTQELILDADEKPTSAEFMREVEKKVSKVVEMIVADEVKNFMGQIINDVEGKIQDEKNN